MTHPLENRKTALVSPNGYAHIALCALDWIVLVDDGHTVLMGEAT